MIEFYCPACDHNNAMSHRDINYKVGTGIQVICSECAAFLIISVLMFPEVRTIRLKKEGD